MVLQQIILDWVEKNYGIGERDNPSWDVDSLAKHIRNEIKKQLKNKEQ